MPSSIASLTASFERLSLALSAEDFNNKSKGEKLEILEEFKEKLNGFATSLEQLTTAYNEELEDPASPNASQLPSLLVWMNWASRRLFQSAAQIEGLYRQTLEQ